MFYVYVLKSALDGNFYIGHTADLRKRVAEHNRGKVDSTRKRMPFELVYYEASRDLSDVIRRRAFHAKALRRKGDIRFETPDFIPRS
jgi:putative endonuclease